MKNNQGNRNTQTKPPKNTNLVKEQPKNTEQNNINSGKIKPTTDLTSIKIGTTPLNINNPNNSINNNPSSNTQTRSKNIVATGPNNPQINQNTPRRKGNIAANNSQTKPNRESKVTQKTTRQNPASPPISNPKINPPVGVPVFATLPSPPPIINPPSNNNSSSNTNNTQITPPPVSKSEISQKNITRDIAAQIPPLPPAPKIANSERVKNDSAPAKNREEILIEKPENIAINTPLETPPSNIIIPQIAEAKEYLQTRWKVPEGLNQTIQYILVLDSDGTITQIQPLGETAKKYRETTNIPAPGDKFVSPLSLGKSPKIRAVFNQDGKVQTFLESE